MKSPNGPFPMSFCLGLSILIAQLTACLGADQSLFDFHDLDISKVVVADARVERLPSGRLKLTTGFHQTWPGVNLPAPAGHWDLSGNYEVVVEARNVGTHTATLYCRVDNPGADGKEHCVTGSLLLGAGE